MPNKPLPEEDLQHTAAIAHDAFAALRGANIFITGGTGFFGHWLLETLVYANRTLSLNIRATVLTRNAAAFREKAPHIADDAAITLLEGDVTRFRFPHEHHTHVVHAAADSTGAQQNTPAYVVAESILEGTRHVLRFALETGAKRMLFVSSGAVYGRNITSVVRIPETFLSAPDPLLLQSSYDEAKRMAEHLCVAYSHGTPLECAVARCFAFVGPHLPLDQHFAIGNFIRDAIDGTPIHIQGDGTPLRSYLYMSDLAAWLWTMLAKGGAGRAYNVGSDEAVSIAALARLVAATLRPAANDSSALSVQIDGVARPGAAPATYVPDVSRAADELGLRPAVSLAEAIRKTAAWHGFVPKQ